MRSLVVTGSMPVFYGPLAPLPERGHRGRTARDVYYGGRGPDPREDAHAHHPLEWFDADRLPEETLDMRYQQSLDAEERALAAMSDSPRGDWQDLTEQFGLVEAPTLFIWGREDAFLTPDYPMMLARMVKRGNLHVMDHVSHHLQEERPGAYHAVVDGFLRADRPSLIDPANQERRHEDLLHPAVAAAPSSAADGIVSHRLATHQRVIPNPLAHVNTQVHRINQ